MGSNKKEINLLICEDDPNQQKALKDIIGHYDFINIVGCVSTGEEMIEKAIEMEVTALLLDLQLSGEIGGLEAYSFLNLRGKNIPAIVVTGARPNAGYTYDLDIIDVVEKPYTTNRLWKAFEKLRNHLAYTRFMDGGGIFIPIVSDMNIQLLLPNEVLFIESVSRKMQVHTITETLETKIPFGAYENYLKNHNFLSVNRSCLVNTTKIDDVQDNFILFPGDTRKAQIAETYSFEVKNILRGIVDFPIL